MRVLGVDPGTIKMGVGVVDSEGGSFNLFRYAVLTPHRRDSLPVRLLHMFTELGCIIEESAPSEVAIEQPFAAKNIRSALAIGHAQAVAMVAAAQAGLPVFTYAPSEVKQAVTDHGGSSKEQVQEMVRVLLDLDAVPGSHDAADALAVAICHVNASQVRDLAMTE